MRYVLGMLILVLGPASLVQAACIEIEAPDLSRYRRQMIAVKLLFNATGLTVSPHDGQGRQVGQSLLNTICFDGVSDLGFLTEASMESQETSEQLIEQANNQVAIEEEESQETEETEIPIESFGAGAAGALAAFAGRGLVLRVRKKKGPPA